MFRESFRNLNGIWYTAQPGIWQTLWLGSVDKVYIEKLMLTPDIDEETITAKPVLTKITKNLKTRVINWGEVILEVDLQANRDNVLKMIGMNLNDEKKNYHRFRSNFLCNNPIGTKPTRLNPILLVRLIVQMGSFFSFTTLPPQRSQALLN